MKQKLWILIVTIVLFAILLVPIPSGICKDGGTRAYTALTYKIVDWNRLTGDGIYDKTKGYLFPNNFKSIDQLWYLEEEKVEHSFHATIIEMNASVAVVQPLEGEEERSSSDRISFRVADFDDINAEVGSVVNVTYTGGIMETYPAQIYATGWKLADDLRNVAYTDIWIDKDRTEKTEDDFYMDLVITKIYANCFFARSVVPSPYEFKLNGELADEWCVGDQISCTYENTYYCEENQRIEADLLTIDVSHFQLEEGVCYKPVIYLYPEEKTKVSVNLNLDGRLTCTYPTYENGWTVTAMPDGTLIDDKGQTYNYLYWEGETHAQYDLSRGFCVKGKDTAAFLEDALAQLGLNRKETNEFIVYWLPLMQNNPYNLISFQTDRYTDAAKLKVHPAPDTLIRVFMAWQASDVYIELPAQELLAPEREGFTVMEWGGTEITY